jgi:hypothetical protein
VAKPKAVCAAKARVKLIFFLVFGVFRFRV